MPLPHHLLPRAAAAVLIAMWVANTALAAPPTSRPATLPATAPSSRPTTNPADAKRVADLTRKAIKLLEAGEHAKAEAVLVEVIPLDPRNVTNLYNMACAQALLGQADRAVAFLRASAEAGWTDFVHIARDPDLASLRDLPAYKDLLAQKPQFQKRAAERALAGLKAQFGDGYLYDLDEERKLIFATNVDATTLADLKKWLTSQANSQWAELFANRPDQFVSVVVPSRADYAKLVKMPGVGGMYIDGAKLLLAQRLGQTMTHEFTHALHAADRAPLGQDHPIWIAEGLAGLYEPAQFEGDVLVPRDNVRHNAVQGAVKAERHIPLAKLIAMEQPAFIQRATLAYGQSASVMLYLREQNLLRKFYDAYKAGYDRDRSGKSAIEQVTGKTLEKFEADWKTWVKARPRVTGDTGPDGVVIGARLAEADNGLRVDQVVPNGPAAKAGVRPGDVLVAVGDAQIRDYASFVPALERYRAGDAVTVKVRRADKYLELPLVLGKRADVADGAGRPRAR